jgi:hypothetical protein
MVDALMKINPMDIPWTILQIALLAPCQQAVKVHLLKNGDQRVYVS